MSLYDNEAIALKYEPGNVAPIVVASGAGHMAQKIIEVATEHNVPVYEDTSLTTVLSKLQLGQAIPDELYNAIVEIYVYFLKFGEEDMEE